MSHSNEERLSADLLAVAEQLSEGKHEASALDLDRIKMQAVAKATRGPRAFAPRKGSLMRKRSLLTTLLVVGALATGTGATMAVTGTLPTVGGDGPTAGLAQYGNNCDQLVADNRAEERRIMRENRADERSERRANRSAERRIRNPRARRHARRINRAAERRQRRANRRGESSLRRAHRAEEARCRAGR